MVIPDCKSGKICISIGFRPYSLDRLFLTWTESVSIYFHCRAFIMQGLTIDYPGYIH